MGQLCDGQLALQLRSMLSPVYTKPQRAVLNPTSVNQVARSLPAARESESLEPPFTAHFPALPVYTIPWSSSNPISPATPTPYPTYTSPPRRKKAARLSPAAVNVPIQIMAPRVGLEPTTLRLTAECSTN